MRDLGGRPLLAALAAMVAIATLAAGAQAQGIGPEALPRVRSLYPSPPGPAQAAPESTEAAAPETVGRVSGGVVVRAVADTSLPWYRRPRWIMLRSVLVPGWGQWANGKHAKALVVAAGEGYLLFRAVDWGRLERRERQLARDNKDDPALEGFHLAEAEHAAGRRRDFTWWSIFAGALSIGDAYVDAQLGKNFDLQFKPQDPSIPGAGRTGNGAKDAATDDGGPGRGGVSSSGPGFVLALTYTLP